MNSIEWKETYSVGNKKIDDQHKQLFEWINALIEKKELNVNSKIIIDTLNDLNSYASYHFETEEKYMIQYNYSDYTTHKKQHESYLKKVAKLSFGALNNDQTVPVELLTFLNKWWINHILETDRKLRSFFDKVETQKKN